MRNRPVVLCLAVASLCLSNGCERDDIRIYTVAKDEKPTTSRAAAASPTRNPINVSWSVPESWGEIPTTEPMRVATFEKGKVQILISTFPGDVGGMLANINRWRGQIGLTPTTEPELAETVITEMSGAVQVNTTRLIGPNEDMLGAVINTGDGNTWFVKAVGTKTEVTELASEFTAFCRSFQLRAAEPQAPSASAGLPANHPPVESTDGTSAPRPPLPESGLLLRARSAKTPDSWKPGRDSSGIAVLAFDTAEGSRITLTSLRGDGGGALANINRWRGQLGLPPVADMSAQPTLQLKPGIMIVDLEDASKARRMISAIVSEQETTWFFKLSGPSESVQAQTKVFEQFVLDSATESEGR